MCLCVPYMCFYNSVGAETFSTQLILYLVPLLPFSVTLHAYESYANLLLILTFPLPTLLPSALFFSPRFLRLPRQRPAPPLTSPKGEKESYCPPCKAQSYVCTHVN